MSPLVSIIVPVYNVEQYLSRCVDSILAQTYSNIQVILVDDESPDQSPSICNSYEERDDRVLCIHQKNRGLAGARASGLSKASGAYVLFVDSDDWVEPDLVATVLGEMMNCQADVGIFGYVKHKSSGDTVHEIDGNHIYTSQKALYEVIRDEALNNFAWDYICKREIYDELTYPTDRAAFEDTYFTYQVFRAANRLVHIDRPFYHYIRRDDSILGRWGLQTALDFVLAQQRRYSDLSITNPELSPLMERAYLKAFSDMQKHLVACDAGEVQECRNRMAEVAKFSKPVISKHKEIKLKRRVGMKLAITNPGFYRLLKGKRQ